MSSSVWKCEKLDFKSVVLVGEKSASMSVWHIPNSTDVWGSVKLCCLQNVKERGDWNIKEDER